MLATSTPATVTTDQTDYPPGSVVTISGEGWLSGEAIDITLLARRTDEQVLIVAGADGEGKFTDSSFSTTSAHVGIEFLVTAVGQESGLTAQTTFSDAIPTWVNLHPTNPIVVRPGQSMSVSAAVHHAEGITFDGTVKFWARQNGFWVSLPLGTGLFTTTFAAQSGMTLLQADFTPAVHSYSYCCGFLCLSTCGGTYSNYNASYGQKAITVCSAPVLSAPADLTIGTGPSNPQCTVPVPPLGQATYTNGCPPVTVSIQSHTLPNYPPRSGAPSLLPLGTTSILWRVTDYFFDGTSTDAQTVTVTDTTPPTLTGQNFTQTVECGDPYNEYFPFSAYDNCSGSGVETEISGVVDTTTPGTYERVARATDAAGNKATLTKQIHVVDTKRPVLTLIGPDRPQVECGTEYVDAGASAIDVCAGTLTPEKYSESVDTSTSGIGLVGWRVTDPAGLTSQVQRTVMIVDTIPPVVTLNGPDTIELECGADYVEQFATATDTCNPAPVYIGAIGWQPRWTVPGTYTIEHRFRDQRENVGNAVRTINVIDTVAPVVTLLGEAHVVHECHTPYVDPGATAHDGCAGALTPVVSGSVDADTPGTYTLTYTATDGEGNQHSMARTVVVVDTTPPALSLTGDESLTLECGSPYADAGITATDTCAGALTPSTAGSVDPGAPGTYQLTYGATDPAGNTATASRTVQVVDTTAPLVTLLGAPDLAHECRTPWFDPGATATDACDGSVVEPAVTGSVDPSAPGEFLLTYSVTDGSSNTGSATRSVHVVDTTVPVVSLNGPSEIVLECRSSYFELGATAIDACDGSVHETTMTGNVDTGVPADYLLTYGAADASGNAASAIRSVHVVDTTPPALSLVGGDITLEAPSPFIDPGATAVDSCGGPIVPAATGVVDVTRPGTYVILYAATDAYGNRSTAERHVFVVDTTAPAILSASATPSVLPRNHKMVDVAISVVATDAVDPLPQARIVGVSSNQPTDGLGDGSTEPDWEITGPLSVRLRGERSGKLGDRVYSLLVHVTDASGNVSSTVLTVTVPHHGR